MQFELRPAELLEMPIVRALFVEYARSLHFDLCFQNFERELAGLPGEYAPPAGGIWLAWAKDTACGCVALHRLSDDVGEMKRLYVRSAFRGFGLGRRLVQQVIDAAIGLDYKCVRLDTLPSMNNARALYVSLGFREIEPYYHNPLPGVRFLELSLRSDSRIRREV